MSGTKDQEISYLQEQYLAWKDQEVTKLFLLWVSRERDNLKEQWANGLFSAAFDTEMIVKNAGATGACSAYQEILNFDYERLRELNDEQ